MVHLNVSQTFGLIALKHVEVYIYYIFRSQPQKAGKILMYRNCLHTFLFKWLTSVFRILETEYLRKVLYFLPSLYHAFFVEG